MCHHNSFLIYDSLEEPTEKRWGIVTHISVGFAMVCTFVLGITGYATFTGFTQGVLKKTSTREGIDFIHLKLYLGNANAETMKLFQWNRSPAG